MTNKQFPDLIKAGLKVGDKVESWMFGSGIVNSIIEKKKLCINVFFDNGINVFVDRKGFAGSAQLVPIIHLTPWNPIIGEPFQFPKWQPKEGEWCAFWDNGDNSFIIAMFDYISDGKYLFKDSGAEWDNCAPISEAMQIFGVTESE